MLLLWKSLLGKSPSENRFYKSLNLLNLISYWYLVNQYYNIKLHRIFLFGIHFGSPNFLCYISFFNFFFFDLFSRKSWEESAPDNPLHSLFTQMTKVNFILIWFEGSSFGASSYNQQFYLLTVTLKVPIFDSFQFIVFKFFVFKLVHFQK